MPTSGSNVFEWTIEMTPPGGIGSTIIFSSGSTNKVRPSSWKLDQRDDVAASSLEIKFPNATQFFNMWNEFNPLTVGSNVVIKADGATRLTGKVFDFKRKFSATDRSVTVICRDRMGSLKDAVVDIDVRRNTFRKVINLLRKNPLSSIFLSVETVPLGASGAITAYADNGDGTTRITTAGAHGMANNTIIKITGTTNYNGVYNIQEDDATHFDIALDFVANDATGTYTQVGWIRPWAEDFFVPMWVNDPANSTSGAKRILFSEYTPLYEVGGIAFNENTVRVIGDIDADEQTLDAVEDDIFADIVYYDSTDTSTMVSNLMRLAFEQSEVTGGLAWTEDTEYRVTDETTSDILSGMQWNTNEGDGDAVSFIQSLYDNPKIGLSPSYWMRDFNGDGQVELRLVTQDNDNAIDVDIILDSELPNPFSSIYSRAVLVNNTSTRRNLMRDATIVDVFPTGDFPEGDVIGVTETQDHPVSSAAGVENLQDGTAKTSWGYFAVGGKAAYDLDMVLPIDKPLFRVDFGQIEEIDSIYMKSVFNFFGGDESHPTLHDNDTGEEAVNGIYMDKANNGIHESMRVTVEYNTSITGTPNPDAWYVLHPDLYMVEMDIIDPEFWVQIENLNKKTRHLRVVVNNPAFVKVGESNWSAKAYRALMWFMSEFIVLARGRVLDNNDEQPTVQFTDDPNDVNRCMWDITGNLVDMYRPTLLKFLKALGLKYKSLIIEADDVWDFTTKVGDVDDVGFGYKLLVTRLDAASKENEWRVMIDPRPDIRIGHTVYSSKLDPDKKFTVHGNSLQNVSGRLIHMLTLSDHESTDGDEPSGFCGA